MVGVFGPSFKLFSLCWNVGLVKFLMFGSCREAMIDFVTNVAEYWITLIFFFIIYGTKFGNS